MKTLTFLLIFIPVISLFGCDNGRLEQSNNLDVHLYVELLKQGKYDSQDLPSFTFMDIPELLEYRNETQLIKDFPTNKFSSFWMDKCSLGMYILWTIESIRAVEIDSKDLADRFPSQNPIVRKKGESFDLESSIKTQEIVSQAYYEWWQENKNNEFDTFKNIDPLFGTELVWH